MVAQASNGRFSRGIQAKYDVNPSGGAYFMKRLGAVLIVFVLLLPVSVLAQNAASSDSGQQQNSTPQTSTKTSSSKPAKTRHLTGIISEDDKTFTDAETNDSWKIVNPEAVKGHEQVGVLLTARVDSRNDSIDVLSVKPLPETPRR